MEDRGNILDDYSTEGNITSVLIGRDDQTSEVESLISKDLIRAIVIAAPILAALILAPILLSCSKKRLVRRMRTSQRSTFIVRKLKKKNNQNSRNEESYLKGARVIETPACYHSRTTSGKSPNNGISPRKPQNTKSNLKRSKMFIESEFPSHPDSRQHKRIRIPKLKPVSVELDVDLNRIEEPLARCSPGKRHSTYLGLEDPLPQGSRPHSWMTVIQNMTYEDTIPSYPSCRMDIAPTPAPGNNPAKPIVTSLAKQYHPLNEAAFQDSNKSDASQKESLAPPRVIQMDGESKNQELRMFPSRDSQNGEKIISIKQTAANNTHIQSLSPLSGRRKPPRKSQINSKEEWRPLLSREVNTKTQPVRVKNQNRSPLSSVVSHSESKHYFRQKVLPGFAKSGSSRVAISDEFIPHELQSKINPSEIKSLQNIFPNPIYPDKNDALLKNQEKATQNHFRFRKNRRKRRKLKLKRRIRDERYQNRQRRLMRPDPVTKSGIVDPVTKSGIVNPDTRKVTTRSYCYDNNDQISGYIGNWHRNDTDTSDEGDSLIGRRIPDSPCDRYSHRTGARMSESTLLEEIWLHLTLLTERSRLNEDSSSSLRSSTSSDSSCQAIFGSSQSLANQENRRGLQISSDQSRGAHFQDSDDAPDVNLSDGNSESVNGCCTHGHLPVRLHPDALRIQIAGSFAIENLFLPRAFENMKPDESIEEVVNKNGQYDNVNLTSRATVTSPTGFEEIVKQNGRYDNVNLPYFTTVTSPTGFEDVTDCKEEIVEMNHTAVVTTPDVHQMENDVIVYITDDDSITKDHATKSQNEVVSRSNFPGSELITIYCFTTRFKNQLTIPCTLVLKKNTNIACSAINFNRVEVTKIQCGSSSSPRVCQFSNCCESYILARPTLLLGEDILGKSTHMVLAIPHPFITSCYDVANGLTCEIVFSKAKDLQKHVLDRQYARDEILHYSNVSMKEHNIVCSNQRIPLRKISANEITGNAYGGDVTRDDLTFTDGDSAYHVVLEMSMQ